MVIIPNVGEDVENHSLPGLWEYKTLQENSLIVPFKRKTGLTVRLRILLLRIYAKGLKTAFHAEPYM